MDKINLCEDEMDEETLMNLLGEDIFDEVEEVRISDGEIMALSKLINIPSANLSVRTGCYLIYDVACDDYVPDFSLTAVYEYGEESASKYLYWEQDGIAITIHNYLNAIQQMETSSVA